MHIQNTLTYHSTILHALTEYFDMLKMSNHNKETTQNSIPQRGIVPQEQTDNRMWLGTHNHSTSSLKNTEIRECKAEIR
ncbi:hypothetical protein Tsubulata_005399, partial [Turnera subulata]